MLGTKPFLWYWSAFLHTMNMFVGLLSFQCKKRKKTKNKKRKKKTAEFICTEQNPSAVDLVIHVIYGYTVAVDTTVSFARQQDEKAVTVVGVL